MTDPRQIKKLDGTPIQQGMVQLREDYNNYRMHKPVLGIVLDVYLSDAESNNRVAAQFADRRGFLHMARVLVIDDGGPANFIPPDVIITPDDRTGMDDYAENLPKPTTRLVTGEELNDGHHHVDPHTLDGDMCVIEFLGGRLNSGFITRWWPHTSNTFDPATCGEGNPDASGEGTSLDQSGRKFTRVNGVEQIITRDGNVYLSTSFGGTKTIPGGPRSKLGRFSRDRVPSGGNIRVNVKPSALLELDWNFQEDGIGSANSHDPSLPQTNPPRSLPYTLLHNGSLVLEGTYVRFEEKKVLLDVPDEIKFKSNNRIIIEAESENIFISRGITSIDSESVISLESRADIIVAARGPLSLAGSSVAIEAGVPTVIAGTGITIGPLGAGKVLVEEDGAVLLGPDTGADPLDRQRLIVDGAVADPLDTVLGKNQGLVDGAVADASKAIADALAAPGLGTLADALAFVGAALLEINSLLQDLGVTEFTKAN